MPHLTIEYSSNLDSCIDMGAFCAAMRDALMATGIFPLGGVRVRAFPCHTYVIADGDAGHAYLHMICRVGAGRDEATRLAAAEAIYSAAEARLKAEVPMPMALSLDFDELHAVTSLKRFNTIHGALKEKGLG